MEQAIHKPVAITLPEPGPDALFYLVLLHRVDGGIEPVTHHSKAEARVNLYPGQYTHWEYVLVE